MSESPIKHEDIISKSDMFNTVIAMTNRLNEILYCLAIINYYDDIYLNSNISLYTMFKMDYDLQLIDVNTLTEDNYLDFLDSINRIIEIGNNYLAKIKKMEAKIAEDPNNDQTYPPLISYIQKSIDIDY